MSVYIVYRLYCSPNKIVCCAKNEKEASLISNTEYGYSETKVEKINIKKSCFIMRGE